MRKRIDMIDNTAGKPVQNESGPESVVFSRFSPRSGVFDGFFAFFLDFARAREYNQPIKHKGEICNVNNK